MGLGQTSWGRFMKVKLNEKLILPFTPTVMISIRNVTHHVPEKPKEIVEQVLTLLNLALI